MPNLSRDGARGRLETVAANVDNAPFLASYLLRLLLAEVADQFELEVDWRLGHRERVAMALAQLEARRDRP